MMSPAFFEPIFDPLINLASFPFIFQSSQIASRTNKSLKYHAKPVDKENFTIANFTSAIFGELLTIDSEAENWQTIFSQMVRTVLEKNYNF